MWVSYDDILDRIPEPPLWWLNGVPRSEPFEPSLMGVCDGEALLVEAECQVCGKRFTLGLYPPVNGIVFRRELEEMNDLVGRQDPPSHHCPGNSMTAAPRRILEFWENLSAGRWPPEWQRIAKFEGKLPD